MPRFIALLVFLLAGCSDSPDPTRGESNTTVSDSPMDDLDKRESGLPTDVATVVTAVQAKYHTYYETCIQAYGDRKAFAAELLILVNDGPKPLPVKHRLWRTDAIWRENEDIQPTQFEVDPAPPFAPITEVYPSGITVTVNPFVWNACEFHFESSDSEWNSVDRWHAKWIDENDTKSRDQHGLAGVIHWLRQPIRDGRHVNLLVDFGSASTDAFHEMIDALVEAGVTDVTVASFDYPTQR